MGLLTEFNIVDDDWEIFLNKGIESGNFITLDVFVSIFNFAWIEFDNGDNGLGKQ